MDTIRTVEKIFTIVKKKKKNIDVQLTKVNAEWINIL